jgi:hypothetical protein
MYDDSLLLLCLHCTNQDQPRGYHSINGRISSSPELLSSDILQDPFSSLVGDTAGGLLASELLNVRADFISLLHNISVVHLIT